MRMLWKDLELELGIFSGLVREADPLLTVCACPDGFDLTMVLLTWEGGEKLTSLKCTKA
jgi:hypothetical protein